MRNVCQPYEDYKFPDGIEAFGWIMELLPLLIVLLYPIIPIYRARSEGFKGKDLYNELFKPTEKWYSAQMDRRTAEIKAVQDAKYVHHNLGFEEDMKGQANLERERYQNEPPPAYDEITVDDTLRKAQMEEIESLPEAEEIIVLPETKRPPPKINVENIELKVSEGNQEPIEPVINIVQTPPATTEL